MNIIEIRYDWCKSCGICMAFCPGNVLQANHAGQPEAVKMENCIGCMLCEYRCPDFAIRVGREQK